MSDSTGSELLNSVFYPVRIYREDIEVSSSFSFSKNAGTEKPSSFQFAEKYDLGMRLRKAKSYWDFSVHSEFGYRYYLDSTWSLTDDNLSISFYHLNSPEKKLNHTYSLQINTTILPAYKMKKGLNDSYHTIKSGDFFNPGDLQLAYGFSWRFWEYSILNVSLATIKIQSSPIYESPDDNSIYGKYLRVWRMDYGCSFNTRISQSFSKRLRWDNQTRFFFNSFDKNTIRLDLNNRFQYKLFKWLGISAQTRVLYMPLIRAKVQFQQEFQLGLEWQLSPAD